MAKKLYAIGFDYIKHYISLNKESINKSIKNNDKYELAKIFGRAYYELAIKDFFNTYRIDNNHKYALQILNIFKSMKFIDELYLYLGLDIFNNSGSSDDRKSIFYCFVNFLYENSNKQKDNIKQKIFLHYFLHYISLIIPKTDTYLNFKNMTLSYIKGKDIVVKESYKIEDNKVIFNILVDGVIKINLYGASVKTLRKKAYRGYR